MVPFVNHNVKKKFDAYPADVRLKLLVLRELIFGVAASNHAIGPLEETLKWDEPSYIPSQSKSGSMVRIDWKKQTPDNYYLYFLCTTTIVAQIRYRFGDAFIYSGNRALVFDVEKDSSWVDVCECVELAFTYYLKKHK